MAFWWWDPNPQNVIVWLEYLIADMRGSSEILLMSALYLLILT